MKKNQIKPYAQRNASLPKINEPIVAYQSLKTIPSDTSFSYDRFQTLLEALPFSQKEWAEVLHLSEKTLQRYAKDAKSFDGLLSDRLYLLEELVSQAEDVFENPNDLFSWLQKDKNILGYKLNFSSLKSATGIYMLKDELGRILQGVYI